MTGPVDTEAEVNPFNRRTDEAVTAVAVRALVLTPKLVMIPPVEKLALVSRPDAVINPAVIPVVTRELDVMASVNRL